MKMRKILAALVAAVMVLSMIPVMAVTTSAVDVEGDWITCRSANDYDEEQENGSYKPAPGYHYTDDGFQTIAADYTNTMPYFHVMSREAHSLKDGLYLEVRVDDFDYNGWLSFTLWDSSNFSILDTNGYGSGWSSLVSGHGTGASAGVTSNIVLEDGNDIGEQSFMKGLGNTTAVPTVEDGKEIYTLEVTYDGSQYNIMVCGQLVAGCPDITDLFDKISPTGDFYIGIAMFSSTPDGTAGLSILKFGTSKADAETPVGSDSADPEPNANVFADMMPADSVAENTPALLYNAVEYSAPQVANAEVSALGDGAYRFTSRTTDMYFRWVIRNDTSYNASDFPVIAFMVRSYDASGGAVYYCSDKVFAADAQYMTSWGLWDEGSLEYTDDEGVYYNMVIVDLSEQWDGRINQIRFDFSGMDTDDEESATFDFCWAGTFRSVEEARSYTEAWANEKDLSGTDVNVEDTEAPTDAEAPTDQELDTPADVADTEDATTSPADIEATEGNDSTDNDEGGCGSVVAFGTVGVLMTAMTAAVALKKKHD